MKWIKGIAIASLLIFILLSTGCSFAPSGQRGTTPTPSYGTVKVSSSPLGAKMTLDGVDKGYTPLTLTGIPVGVHNISLSLAGYNTESGQVEVKGGQEVTFSRNLGEADPRIEVSDIELKRVGCNWEVTGIIVNTGGENAKSLTLTLKMKPKDKDFSDAERMNIIGDFGAGSSRRFTIEVTASCATGYTGELKWEFIDAEGDKHSGSKGL
ncbi:MAG: PEGA domain-containing protein [Methanomicrobiales archaeon]|nr:PEGA domain-containing protein [Methanomicrobiales archaeon]